MGRRWRKIGRLFFLGISIGFCLEILLFERDRFDPGSSKGELSRPSPRIACLVLVKHNLLRYVDSSMETWLKHCDEHHVVHVERSKEPLKPATVRPDRKRICPKGSRDSSCPAGEDGSSPWQKNKEVKRVVAKSGWSGLCKAILGSVGSAMEKEWLMVVPDNLIVLAENLRFFVGDFDPEDHHYFGHPLEHYEADYNVLSAGILLSRGSLRKLMEKFRAEADCDRTGKHWRNEDFYLGKYLKEFGIFPGDARDEKGRGRFHGYNIDNLLSPGNLMARSDYVRKALFPVAKGGFDCCSPFSITLDVSHPDATYKLYFLLYKLKTILDGSVPNVPEEEKKKKKKPANGESFFWKDFLRERGYGEEEIEKISSDEYYRIWEEIIPPESMYRQMRDFMSGEEVKEEKERGEKPN